MVFGLFKKKEKKIDFLNEKLETKNLTPLPPRIQHEIKQGSEPPISKSEFSKPEIHKITVSRDEHYNRSTPILRSTDKKSELPKFEEPKLGIIEKKMLLTAVHKPISESYPFKSKTLFLQYDDLNLMLENIKLMKKSIISAETTVSNIKDTWGATNAEINTLSNRFEGIQRELIFVDKLIFEKKVGW